MKIFAVEGIGNIHFQHRDFIMRDAANKPEVTFHTLTGKNIDSEKHYGHVIRISDDERYAIIETETEIESMQNILIEIGGSLYAKVLSTDSGQITICFTSKPDCFSEWVKSMFCF